MVDLQLSAAFMDHEQTRALVTGEVKPQAITLNASTIYPTKLFWRQLHFGDFDVSEMSLSSLLILTAKGQLDWVALPIFPMRRMWHTRVLIRRDRGIVGPADLAGKNVGVPEYQQTAALWTRGILRDEFALEPSSMRWYMERNPDRSHGGATGFKPPAGIELAYVRPDKNLGDMLIEGELDAIIHVSPGSSNFDRTVTDPRNSPVVRYLFDPPAGEAARFYAKTGLYPINHCVVVRRSVVEAHPWVVHNLCDAFDTAKARTVEQLNALLELHVEAGVLDDGCRAAVRKDLMPYGIRANRAVLEAATRYCHNDGLTSRIVGVDEIFATQTLEL